jgi:hypothetical protein
MNREDWILSICNTLNINLNKFTTSDLYKIQTEVNKKAGIYSTKSDIEIESLNIDFNIKEFSNEDLNPSLILQALSDHIETRKDKVEIGSKTILCLDRDMTISTGTPPGPIPKQSAQKIKQKAHLTLATGNQRLKTELDIPGKFEIKQLNSEKEQKAKKKILKEYNQDYSYTITINIRLPRREAIRKVKNSFPSKKIIVIDDEDLSDLQGIYHYQPYEFFKLYLIKD